MRFITITAALAVLILTIYVLVYQPYLPKDQRLVNTTLAKGAEIIESKYDLIPVGTGISMPGGPIRELGLYFYSRRPYSKEELRELLIKTAQELLDQVTENQEIQQYIKEPPFTIKNIQIIIYNHDNEGGRVYDPGIAVGQISEAILTYATVDAKNTYVYKDEFKESYEEALKALSISTSDNSSQSIKAN